MSKILIGAVLFFGFTTAAEAGSSPAQIGYCVEALQYWINLMAQNLTCSNGITAEQCNTISAPARQQLDTYRRTFESWRLAGLSMLSTSSGASLEFLRGQTQAKSDIALVNSRVDAQMAQCNSAPNLQACLNEKGKESDPAVDGLRERQTVCLRGPEL